METITRDDLGMALRLVRDAARQVRDNGWETSPLMQDAVDTAVPLLARSYELPGEVDGLRTQLAVNCVSWRELHDLIRGTPTNQDLKQTARFLARQMAGRADGLLAWLQAPKE